MKSGPDDLDSAEIELGAQNMKTRSDTLGTVENEYGNAEHGNDSQHSRYRSK
jgi:hypothetical protein